MSDTFISPAARLWTRENFVDLIAEQMRNVRFIVVSNREPYVHRHSEKGIECIQPASGLASALDPVMKASGGVWVAHGSGDADREVSDADGHIQVPPSNPSYTLRRVWLSSQLVDEYYYGMANEGLWPLCHIAFQRPIFNRKDWESYRRANQIFANTVLEEAKGEAALVFIQDYHFGLLPRMLKNRNPNLIVAQFWHIPWPNSETFRAFPWKEELLDGMLGNDLLGFHLRHHCANFLDTVDRGLEAMVDHEHAEVTRGGRITMVRPFPISIDFDWHTAAAAAPEVDRAMEHWRARLGRLPDFLGIGIDRIDYTKGIPERLRALDLFFEQHPEYRGRVVFVQIGVPSRVQIEQYRALNAELELQVNQLNEKWGTEDYQPLIFCRGDYSLTELMGLHRMAQFCIVSSLHDGMNLVAKEFVASRFDEDGILILSNFAGAARELTSALLVNPFSTDEISDAIYRALTMPAEERSKRMQRMRTAIAENNVYRWAGKILSTLLKVDIPEAAPDLEGRRVWGAAGVLP